MAEEVQATTVARVAGRSRRRTRGGGGRSDGAEYHQGVPEDGDGAGGGGGRRRAMRGWTTRTAWARRRRSRTARLALARRTARSTAWRGSGAGLRRRLRVVGGSASSSLIWGECEKICILPPKSPPNSPLVAVPATNRD